MRCSMSTVLSAVVPVHVTGSDLPLRAIGRVGHDDHPFDCHVFLQ